MVAVNDFGRGDGWHFIIVRIIHQLPLTGSFISHHAKIKLLSNDKYL